MHDIRIAAQRELNRMYAKGDRHDDVRQFVHEVSGAMFQPKRIHAKKEKHHGCNDE